MSVKRLKQIDELIDALQNEKNELVKNAKICETCEHREFDGLNPEGWLCSRTGRSHDYTHSCKRWEVEK